MIRRGFLFLLLQEEEEGKRRTLARGGQVGSRRQKPEKKIMIKKTADMKVILEANQAKMKKTKCGKPLE